MKNNLQINLQKDPAKDTVRIITNGDLLSSVSLLKRKLNEAVTAGSILTLEIKNCGEVALPCLQLLVALQNTAYNKNKKLTIKTSGSEEFEKIISRTGFSFLLQNR